MSNVYEIASRLLSSIKLTSDNLGMNECYFRCAGRQHLDELRAIEPQVIWGRRGTGKTTLLKAFTYDINSVSRDPSIISIYIVMAKIIPTGEEIRTITEDGSGLAVYVFSKIVYQISEELEKEFNNRSNTLERYAEEKFTEAFCGLQDYIDSYQKFVHGGECSVDDSKSRETKKEMSREGELSGNFKLKIASLLGKILKKKTNISTSKTGFSITGKLQFNLETQMINKYITNMLNALGVSLAYICLDEYSEMDKISEYSIQSKVAQLIKQVFFKTPMFSVKIATVWNKTKLHSKGGTHIQGIEYTQDIFPGPDLDIMFMVDNIEVLGYFKEVLINAYFISVNATEKEKSALADYLVNEIFGEHCFNQIICGSQGVSRSFMILVQRYLQKFIRIKNGKLKSIDVYEMIKQHYIEDVRYKISLAYSVYKSINTYVTDKQCRYFLITRSDYKRCNTIIKYLASRGLMMQIPGQNTDRRIRDDYKLFVIHYGSYLDALDVQKYKKARKILELDAQLDEDNSVIPKYDDELLSNPDKYTVVIPEDAENEIVCSHCQTFFIEKSTDLRIECPKCHTKMLRFEAFIDDVAI